MDNHSTTPVDPRVFEEMIAVFYRRFRECCEPESCLRLESGGSGEKIRASGLAALIHCDPKEIIFTSGATESNNLALKGVARDVRGKR